MALRTDDPTSVGGYRLEDRLGAGGMGVVYLARSPSGEQVALKVVRREWAEEPEFRDRFQLEVAAARMVHSKFTVPVIDADPYAESPWMATPYVRGQSLAARVREHGPLTVEELWDLGQGLARALRDIHRAGLVHRDLKPANVLLAGEGPRVIDFGISRALDSNPLTQTGQIVGTPAFMAPEQFLTRDEVGPAADIFSLGCVLAFAATGRSPFEAGSPHAAAYQAVYEEPQLEGIPAALLPTVLQCLDKEPALRPAPDDVIEQLAAAGLSAAVPTRGNFARSWRTVGRLARKPIVLTALFVICTAGIVADYLPEGAWVMESGRAGTAVGGTSTRLRLPAGSWETGLAEGTDPGGEGVKQCISYQSAIYCGNPHGDPANAIMGINATDGKVMWKRAVIPQTEGEAGPDNLAVAGGQIFCSLGDGALYALNPRTGAIRWRIQFSHEDEIYFTRSTLYRAFSDQVTAIDAATKKTRWNIYLPWSGASLISTDHGLYASQWDNQHTTITTINEHTGELLGTRTLNGQLDYLASAPGVLYFIQDSTPNSGTAQAVVRLDTRTGRAARFPLPPAARDMDEGFITVKEGTIYLRQGNSAGLIIALDAKTGKRLWQAAIGAHVSFWLMTAETAYAATRSGAVVALDTHTGKEIWRTLPQRPSHASRLPVSLLIAHNRLFEKTNWGTLRPIDIQITATSNDPQ